MKKSKHVQRKLEKRQQNRKLDSHIEEQFGGGRLLACISSRPGQCGRADGYVTFLHFLSFLSAKCQIVLQIFSGFYTSPWHREGAGSIIYNGSWTTPILTIFYPSDICSYLYIYAW